MPSKYPTTNDIESRIEASGFTVPSSLGLSDIQALAVEWFENYTRHKPFLVDSDAAASTRYYHEANRGILKFDCGFVSSESVAITISDVALTDGTDYVLHRDSLDRDGPYTWAQLNRNVIYSFNCIEVEGVVGYGTELPQGAWEAVIRYACALAAPDCVMAKSQGLSELAIGNGDLRFKWGSGATDWAAANEKRAMSLAKMYKLRSL